MSKKKTNFGNLLAQYREGYRGQQRISRRKSSHKETLGLSQIALEHLLIESGYYITSGLVNKYESGVRNPPPEFIHNVGKVLKLQPDQIDALVNARFADDQLKFLLEYNNLK